jgi:hypothetical protein
MLIVKERGTGQSAMLSDGSGLAGLVYAHEAMRRAGVLLGVEGLHDRVEGVRIQYAGHTPSIARGPFEDGDAGISGFWLIEVTSIEEAVEWARMVPLVDGEIEVRQAAVQILQTDPESLNAAESERESVAVQPCLC